MSKTKARSKYIADYIPYVARVDSKLSDGDSERNRHDFNIYQYF
jgi:hypothetical protein